MALSLVESNIATTQQCEIFSEISRDVYNPHIWYQIYDIVYIGACISKIQVATDVRTDLYGLTGVPTEDNVYGHLLVF